MIGFGFGFNKAKVLASAEKNVKQGKLHAAIAEYEKVVKEDPKDLNVLNTIGDLYARIGKTEQAVDYFKRVGDAYASDGFTVKAIAMYKKLTKLSPTATGPILKLAELYTQNGLFNDARAQYMQVADQHMRAGELEQAVTVFQKMLELDPDNAIMQSRLAELYVKLGKKPEARDIYYRAAESLRQRGALDAADDALAHVIELDPTFTQAATTRGQVKLEAGDAEGALEVLEHLPDIDSRPEALRAVFQARIKLGHLEEAEPVAKKLLTVFNEPAAVFSYVDAMIAAGSYEGALKFYREHAEPLLAANPQLVVESLRSLVGKVKSNARALEMLTELFRMAGETSQLTEVTELLAHACVQSGDLARARELYKWLAEEEPENPLHAQNYKQVLARLGEDSSTRQFTPEEGTQAFMVEELQSMAPQIDQEYASNVAEAIRSALTDAELFDSYNLAHRAIQPLEKVLLLAPCDTNVNQRLASLYARTGKLVEAARCCAVLEGIYREAGHTAEADKYGDIAAKYAERAGISPGEMHAAAEKYLAQHAAERRPAVPQSAVSDVAPLDAVSLNPEEYEESSLAAEMNAAPSLSPEFAVEAPAQQDSTAESSSHEIDLSSEWDRMLQVEPTHETPVAGEASSNAAVWESFEEQATSEPAVADLVEEIRFYISQSMWEEAGSAIRRCESIAPNQPELADFKAQLAAASAAPAPPEEVEVLEREPLPPPKTTSEVSQMLDLDAEPEPLMSEESQVHEEHADNVFETPAVPPPMVRAETSDELGGLVSDLEDTLGDRFGAQPALTMDANPQVSAPSSPELTEPVISANSSPVAADSAEAASELSDIFAEFKEDMESTTSSDEDPETHYNLGMAFREMGLLDEAIGEFQKVCQIVDRGHVFPNTLQAYTWLADCFVQKGVPEAGIRWYEKALKFGSVDEETSTAIHYELGCAYEIAGNKKGALSHFMEVYGTNIDYRDVAERIKALKS